MFDGKAVCPVVICLLWEVNAVNMLVSLVSIQTLLKRISSLCIRQNFISPHVHSSLNLQILTVHWKNIVRHCIECTNKLLFREKVILMELFKLE